MTLFVTDDTTPHTIRADNSKWNCEYSLWFLQGSVGSTDGKGSAARFYDPTGIAVSPNGTLFVADQGNNTIRQITTDGTVTTLCGKRGSRDGKGSAAGFYSPYGITFRYNIEWSPKNHSLFPLVARKQVLTVLMMSARKYDGTPWHPDTHFHTLPKDVLFLILRWSISFYQLTTK